MREDMGLVHIVDDDDMVRTAGKWLLEGHGYDVETWPDAESFLVGAKQSAPGVILLDLRMPGMGGMGLLEGHGDLLQLPVIVVTAHGDVPLAVRAIQAGALTMLEKPVRTDEMLRAIAGAMVESERLSRNHAEREELVAQLEQLTPRERKVLTLLAHGHRNKTVAEIIDISHRTVAVHRQRILNKTRSDTVTDLLHRISRLGLLDQWAMADAGDATRDGPD